MNTAIRVALTIAVMLRPLGESQSSDGLMLPGASPAYTLIRAKNANATSVATSMPSSAYWSRTETSIPR